MIRNSVMKKQLLSLVTTLLVSSASQAYWQPHGQMSWQIQFSGSLNPNVNTQVFDVDLFDVFVNNIYLGMIRNIPFNFSFVPEDVENIQDVNELKV